MKKFRYKNVLLYASHQWCGNIEKYFSSNSEKLIVFLLMPRIQTDQNIVRIYKRGILLHEIKISLSENFFLYYIKWYLYYLKVLLMYFSFNEKVIVISAHIYPFFFMNFQRLVRKVEFVFWAADYFPPINKTLRFYELLKKYYHDGIKYTFYLGDGVNKKMNGEVKNTLTKKTIMWGVDPKEIRHDKKKNTLLYVGVIRPSSGLELAYNFLKENKKYKLYVIGVCDKTIYQQHMKKIKEWKIEDRVYFPNIFFSQEQLEELSKDCFVGIAPYTIDKTNVIYYSDPGKVKTYAELNLPVILTKTSSILPFVIQFGSGIAIDRTVESFADAVKRIHKYHVQYSKGVSKFNKFFYYQRYYSKNFSALEKI